MRGKVKPPIELARQFVAENPMTARTWGLDVACDAAARAETLEAEVAKWNKCDSLVCPYEQRALAAEAALAPLRAVVEDLRSWLFEQFDVVKSRDSITARAIAASFKDVIIKLDALSALPADPSAPTPR